MNKFVYDLPCFNSGGEAKHMRISYALLLLSVLSGSVYGFTFSVVMTLPHSPIVPKDNPQTPAKIELGKQLFFDPRLSVDKSLSCNSCHNLAAGGDDDGMAKHLEQRTIRRSAPSLYNVAFQSVNFWDARAHSLEQAITEHLLDKNIMALQSENKLIQRLQSIKGYEVYYQAAFKHAKMNVQTTSKALASFIRTLVTPNSQFDQYLNGDKQAISANAKRGYKIFNDYGCMSCHFGVYFAGPAPGPAYQMGDGFYELFPNYLGSDYDKKYDLTSDDGRVQVTGDAADRYLWRVPGLRNITMTAPYFHNGSVNDLNEAIRIMGKVQLGLNLNDNDVRDIRAFLESLTGEYPEIKLPRLPDTHGLSLQVK